LEELSQVALDNLESDPDQRKNKIFKYCKSASPSHLPRKLLTAQITEKKVKTIPTAKITEQRVIFPIFF